MSYRHMPPPAADGNPYAPRRFARQRIRRLIENGSTTAFAVSVVSELAATDDNASLRETMRGVADFCRDQSAIADRPDPHLWEWRRTALGALA